MRFEIIDVHSHLADEQFSTDREEVLARMRKQRVGTIVVGVNYESSAWAVALAREHEGVWACVGVHPEDGAREVFIAEKYTSLFESGKVVAVGECGFDYFRKPKEEVYEKQRALFEAHIEFAGERALPLMLHIRASKGSFDAYDDALFLLREYKNKFPHLKGNVHFFAGDISRAQAFFDLDFTISFTGVISFAREYREVVSFSPLSNIHAETDAPFVAPLPYRGQRNEPMFVEKVIACIAEIKKLSVEEVKVQLRKNAENMFGI